MRFIGDVTTMKPLITLIVSSASLAIVAATAPDVRGRLLSAAVGTAWAQQDRGHDDKEKNKDKDKDHDARDNDRGSGHDDRSDRGNDPGGGNDDKSDRGSDRGGGNDDKSDRGSDRGGGNDDKSDRGNDRGGGNDDKSDRGSDRGGGNDDKSDRGSDRGGGDASADNRGSNSDTGNPGGAGPTDTAGERGDRGADPAERVGANDGDNDATKFAGRFDLEDTETFDNDGYLARRGEIIAMSSDTLLRRRVEALGLEVIQQESLPALHTTMYRISVPAAAPVDGILARLRAQDPQGVFDRNHLYDRSASTSAAASYSGVPARAVMGSAKGITVGLIDTGVDALHPALAGTHVELRYFVDQSRELPEAHGTAVVSLLVAPEFGMLPDAQLYVACVFYEDRRGGALSEAGDLVRALDWLMKLRVPVINMSLSGPPNAVLHTAIQRAQEAGHLIVAAVGNGGPGSPPLYPAAYEGVIGVTAVDGQQHVYRRANRGAQVQLAAMGVDVVAAAPAGLATYSGTSFASPYVAALAAMEYRALNPQQVPAAVDALRGNALDLGKPGRDEVYGFGLARPRAVATVAR